MIRYIDTTIAAYRAEFTAGKKLVSQPLPVVFKESIEITEGHLEMRLGKLWHIDGPRSRIIKFSPSTGCNCFPEQVCPFCDMEKHRDLVVATNNQLPEEPCNVQPLLHRMVQRLLDITRTLTEKSFGSPMH